MFTPRTDLLAEASPELVGHFDGNVALSDLPGVRDLNALGVDTAIDELYRLPPN